MMAKNLFCTWQSGMISCLSLYHALKKQNKVKCLVTSVMETSGSHGFHKLPHKVLRHQADLIKLPILIFHSSSKDYQENYGEILMHIKKKHRLDGGIFPGLSHEKEKKFSEDFCRRLNLQSYFPLWQKDPKELALEFIDLGFKAKVIAVHGKKLSRDLLGREVDRILMKELDSQQIDPTGECGEYFCFVYDGPLFSKPLDLKLGELSYSDQYWSLDILS